MGAGLADPDGVLGRDMVLPKADRPLLPLILVIWLEPTDRRDGRGVEPIGVDVFVSRRCGIRDGVVSSAEAKVKKNID